MSIDEQIAAAKQDVRKYYDTDHKKYLAAERRLDQLQAAKRDNKEN